MARLLLKWGQCRNVSMIGDTVTDMATTLNILNIQSSTDIKTLNDIDISQ